MIDSNHFIKSQAIIFALMVVDIEMINKWYGFITLSGIFSCIPVIDNTRLRLSVYHDWLAHPYKRDLKEVDFHLLDTGHFALEEDGDVIAEHIRRFLGD